MNAHPLPYGREKRALPLLWQHMDAPFGREHFLKMRFAHSLEAGAKKTLILVKPLLP
jgi:hypothetical protein